MQVVNNLFVHVQISLFGFYIAKLLIFGEIHKLKEYLEAVDLEDTAVAYPAALARSEDFDVSPTSVKNIS